MAHAWPRAIDTAFVAGRTHPTCAEFEASDTQFVPERVVSSHRVTDWDGVAVYEPALTFPGALNVDPLTRSVSRYVDATVVPPVNAVHDAVQAPASESFAVTVLPPAGAFTPVSAPLPNADASFVDAV